MNNSILVTGGCGFIGSHFVDLLLENNYSVINVDLLTYAAVTLDYKKSNYTFIKGDIKDTNLIKKILYDYKPQNIVNFAAETHVDRSIHNPAKFFSTNIEGTINLLEQLRLSKLNSRFIHISTDEVYGSLALEDSPFNENSPYRPNSPYAASKASADHIVLSYANTYGIDALVTNCSNNFGPRQNQEKLIPLIINSAISNLTIPVYGQGINVRDWIYVKDHCDILLKIIQLKTNVKKKYLIGSENEIKNIEIINQILNILEKNYGYKNLNKLITYVEDRPGHDLRYSIDNNYIKKMFNYKSTLFNTALSDTIEYYINNKKNQKKSEFYDYKDFNKKL